MRLLDFAELVLELRKLQIDAEGTTNQAKILKVLKKELEVDKLLKEYFERQSAATDEIFAEERRGFEDKRKGDAC